jgi:hypothetical protein
MSNITAYTGRILKGKFIPDNRTAFTKAFLRKDGTPMVVTAKKLVPRRSLNANAYWWAVVVPMFMDESGIRNKYEMHRTILIALGQYDERVFGGKKIMEPHETHEMDVETFGNLVEMAAQLFAEMFDGIIPPPLSPQARAMMEGA